MHGSGEEEAVLAINRPDRRLWTYYILRCLVFPPLMPVTLLYHWFRYHSMRYQFTPEGVSMSWGVLFRHQILLNYARIQDIHLESNVVERWLGLARLQIQTASGSASAEMTLEGLPQFEAVRDFLYSRMRGVRETSEGRPPTQSPRTVTLPDGLPPDAAEVSAVLRELAQELRRLQSELGVLTIRAVASASEPSGAPVSSSRVKPSVPEAAAARGADVHE